MILQVIPWTKFVTFLSTHYLGIFNFHCSCRYSDSHKDTWYFKSAYSYQETWIHRPVFTLKTFLKITPWCYMLYNKIYIFLMYWHCSYCGIFPQKSYFCLKWLHQMFPLSSIYTWILGHSVNYLIYTTFPMRHILWTRHIYLPSANSL